MRTLLVALAASAVLLAPAAQANDGASPQNFALMADGPDVVVSVDLTNTGEPRDVDLLRGDETLTRIEFDETAASVTWLVCRDWGYDTDCTTDPQDCSDCDGDGINECPDPECDIWGTFEYTDTCVPTTEAGDHTWTWTISEDGWFSESLDLEVARVDDCQPLVGEGDDDDSGAPGDDDDDDGCGSCSTGASTPLQPLALGLLMGGIGLFGVLFDRRRP